MKRFLGIVLAGGLILGMGSSVRAQQVGNPYYYTPGVDVPPPIPAAGATYGFGYRYSQVPQAPVAGNYTYPPAVNYGTTYQAPRTRFYRRGYSQPPTYRYVLPRGQLYNPNAMAPNYVPFQRYQSYDQGYGRGAYGSDFYGGYYKGYSLGY